MKNWLVLFGYCLVVDRIGWEKLFDLHNLLVFFGLLEKLLIVH
jgi:hypothetical protein